MEYLSNSDIKKVLRLDIGRQTLLKAEDDGRIPEATRVKRGNTNTRKWHISDIPAIGQKYGKFQKPSSQKIISFYTGKGGVLKSSLAFNFGRTLALHGVSVLIVGLDIQESITTLALGETEPLSLDEVIETKGLYHFFKNEVSLAEIIKDTDLPTLKVLPETFELNLLEKELRTKTQREKFLKRKLIPSLGSFDVIIFDNSPNWNLLIENSLVASNVVIAPISCEIGTYQALDKNLNALLEFKNEMELSWSDYIMIPTLLENNKISKQILGSYISDYKDQITNGTIRRTVKGQESMAMKQSIFEYSPSSELSKDYDGVIEEVWTRINKVRQ